MKRKPKTYTCIICRDCAKPLKKRTAQRCLTCDRIANPRKPWLGKSSPMKGVKHTKETIEKIRKAKIGIPQTEAHKNAIRKAVGSGEKSHRYLGNEITYNSLHKRLRLMWGHPKQCEHCGLEEGKKNTKKRYIHYANISNDYKFIKEDWKHLCAKCHGAFDKQKRLCH
jgi:hypothetical protein